MAGPGQEFCEHFLAPFFLYKEIYLEKGDNAAMQGTSGASGFFLISFVSLHHPHSNLFFWLSITALVVFLFHQYLS